MPMHDQTPQVRVLWLLIAYENLPEVDDYIDHLDSIRSPGTRYFFSICDNSSQSRTSRHALRTDVAITSRPDNPGYLDGAREALRNARAQNWATEEWTALSNTDVRWTTGDPADQLSLLDSDTAQVIAPRITEGASTIEKNPHLLTRRTVKRLAINKLLTSTVPSTMAYQAVAWARTYLRASARHSRTTATNWNSLYPDGTQIYAPYGAVMFFSRAFSPDSTLPANVPLLAEEYFIAEAALEAAAPVVYRPHIHAHHDAHTTTGPKITRRRARGTKKAFRAIFDHATDRQ